MEMIDLPNGTYVMGNGLARQQRHIVFDGARVCVFRTKLPGTAWENWSAEVVPGEGIPFTTYVSRDTFRKAVTHVVAAGRKAPRIVVL